MSIVLRRATEDDLSSLADLWMAMMEEHRGFEPRLDLSRTAAASYRSYLMLHCRGPKSLVLLAEDGWDIQGYCCAYVCQNLPMFEPAEFGYISDLYVVPTVRGQGVGTQLLNHVQDWLRQCGVTCIQLQVYYRNERGKVFWQGRGYEPFFGRMWLGLNEQGER